MKKVEANGLKKLSVFQLKKMSGFSGWCSRTITWTSNYSGYVGSADIEVVISEKEMYLFIRYKQADRYTGKERDHADKIRITSSPCHYGGKRYWFLCACGRRVGTLYLGNSSFACRLCHNLTYMSRNEPRRYRRFVSAPDIHRQEEKVKREYYRGEPTRQYRRYLELQNRFLQGLGY